MTCPLSCSAARPFNEAPIHESGKCIHPEDHPRASPPFNEAPIHESGKYDVLMTYRNIILRLQ